MKIGGSDRLTRAAVSSKNTEWSRTPWPSSASMFCSTAGRGPMSNMRLSPKYFHTSDCGPSGRASTAWSACGRSVMETMLHDMHFVTHPGLLGSYCTLVGCEGALAPALPRRVGEQTRTLARTSSTPASVPSTNASDSHGALYEIDVVAGSPSAIGATTTVDRETIQLTTQPTAAATAKTSPKAERTVTSARRAAG